MNNLTNTKFSIFFSIVIIFLSISSLSFTNLSINPQPEKTLSSPQKRLTNETLGTSTHIDFELVSENTGWFVEENKLFITINSGIDWVDITPTYIEEFTIESVYFLDGLSGWVLTSFNSGLGNSFDLFSTQDGGNTWEHTTISDASGQIIYETFDSTYMQWINVKKGWVLIRESTSINFSEGDFYITTDGGYSWEKVGSPIGDNFLFLDEEIGYIAGGPDGSVIQRTDNGGLTWANIANQFSPWGDNLILSLPVLMEDGIQVIAALKSKINAPDEVLLFNSMDNGSSWMLLDQYLFPESHDGSSSIQISSGPLDHILIILEEYSTIINYTPAGFSLLTTIN